MRALSLLLIFLLATELTLAASHYTNYTLIKKDKTIPLEDRIVLNGTTAREFEDMILSNFDHQSTAYEKLYTFMKNKDYHRYVRDLFDSFFMYYEAYKSEKIIESTVSLIIKNIEEVIGDKLGESKEEYIRHQLWTIFEPRGIKDNETNQCISYLQNSNLKNKKIGLH